MSFQYQNYALAEVKADYLSGQSAVGASQLCFGISFSKFGSTQKPVVVRDFRAQVSVSRMGGGNAHFLGNALPSPSWQFSTGEYALTERGQFELQLASHQMEELELLRGASGLRFTLAISAMAKGEVGAVPQHEQVTFDSNLSHWVELLHALGHRELLVVAIPIPKSAPGHLLAAALGKLRAAHLSLQVGDYEAVVSQCRMAIESARKVRKAIAADPDAISLYNTGRRTMNKRERELLIEEAINHYSHLAHHAHENGVLEIFGRTDAVLILSATAGVLTATERYVSEHTGDGNS